MNERKYDGLVNIFELSTQLVAKGLNWKAKTCVTRKSI